MALPGKTNNCYDNIYMPARCRIAGVSAETNDVKRFTVLPEKDFEYHPGEFFMVSLWGAGEIPISTASFLDPGGEIQFCVRKVGRVSSALFSLDRGDTIWIRGPYGNGFPLDGFSLMDILVIAGGIGIAPLRPLLQMKMNSPGKSKTTLIYGSRNPGQIIFRKDTDIWKASGIDTIITVDDGGVSWDGNVGLVTEYLDMPGLKPDNTLAYICGPDLMMRITLKNLVHTGFPEKNVFCTCEKHMKCGVGKCGHCYTGSKYVCIDGPVFNGEDIFRENII